MSSVEGGSNGPGRTQEQGPSTSRTRLWLTLIVLLLVGLGSGFQIANRNLANGKHDLIDRKG